MTPDFYQRRYYLARLRFLAVVMAAVFTIACAPTDSQQGYVFGDPGTDKQTDFLESAGPDLTTRETVQTTLGPPSAISILNGRTWYYISRDLEQFAFFEPDILGQSIVAISFDENSRVTDIRQYTLADARAVTPVSRTTPTGGQELSIIGQFLDNVGRFEPPSREQR